MSNLLSNDSQQALANAKPEEEKPPQQQQQAKGAHPTTPRREQKRTMPLNAAWANWAENEGKRQDYLKSAEGYEERKRNVAEAMKERQDYVPRREATFKLRKLNKEPEPEPELKASNANVLPPHLRRKADQ
ncbi:Hypothetical predicted protein [Lecanosticta acicola]|uniref:Uncharacterized protein n=1 Tax=Lecanosticta acicola TaxID=111012 RepID=A0AAI9EE52_9PEZI|nr:Hypothetical predicted protein [Lecanosticta acicola]